MTPRDPIFRPLLLLLALLVSGCGGRTAGPTCEGECVPFGDAFPGVGECQEGVCTPTFGACVEKDEYDTCDDACAAQGSACMSNACGDSTYLIYSIVEWCEDPDRVGVAIARECDEPIDWQVNNAVRCCCTQD